MKKVIKRIFKDNFMISLPTLIISVFLIIFLIIGLSTKDSVFVDYELSLIEKQTVIEENFVMLNKSTNKVTIDNPTVILDPYDISPLTALVIFSTEEEQSIRVVVKGKTEAADFEYESELTKDHYIPIYGLYADYNNIVELSIVNSVDNTTYTININTAPLPPNIKLPSNINTTYEYFGDNLMLFNSYDLGPVGYDYNGDIRWYLTENLSYSINVLSNNHLLLGTERNLFKSNFKTGLYEIDFLGKIYTEYTLPRGYTGNLVELDNSNLLLSTNTNDLSNNSSIVEVSKEFGFVIRELKISNIFDGAEGKNSLWSFNNNYDISGIAYDSMTNSIFVSCKSLDVVLNIDYQTFQLNYIVGDPNNFNQELVDNYFLTPISNTFEWQYAQGDIEVLSNGDLMIFDNGYKRSKDTEQSINVINSYSRAVTFRIDKNNKTIEQVNEFGKNYALGFYSLYNGNISVYSNDNFLVHSGNINTVNSVPINIYPNLYEGTTTLIQKSKTYEILNGNIMYQINFNNNYDYASKVEITKNVNFSFGNINIGKFEVTKYNNAVIKSKISIFDKVPKRFDISIVQEKDRLVFTGDFEAYDEVYIILENKLVSKKYYVPTTKDYLNNLFDSNYLNSPTKFYISNNGLGSEYDIYISINQVKYNTYLKINFKD